MYYISSWTVFAHLMTLLPTEEKTQQESAETKEDGMINLLIARSSLFVLYG